MQIFSPSVQDSRFNNATVLLVLFVDTRNTIIFIYRIFISYLHNSLTLNKTDIAENPIDKKFIKDTILW